MERENLTFPEALRSLAEKLPRPAAGPAEGPARGPQARGEALQDQRARARLFPEEPPTAPRRARRPSNT
ncbi:MAG: hypothetical protein M0C28_47465 [Candidatus Moduliflexus flocculans]|nr:hypothetical protein [Candidatus Moduliflexus flocculans]